MSQSDDMLDFRVRVHRDESPMLFRAIAALEAAPGMRKRNLFVRQLMEMGLMVMEERMRNQDGLANRISRGLADEVSTSAGMMARDSGLPAAPPAIPESTAEAASAGAVSADPAPVAAAPTTVAASANSTPVEAEQPAVASAPAPAPAPTPAPAPMAVSVAAPVAAYSAPADDDRPPPRAASARAVRMLDGESLE